MKLGIQFLGFMYCQVCSNDNYVTFDFFTRVSHSRPHGPHVYVVRIIIVKVVISGKYKNLNKITKI